MLLNALHWFAVRWLAAVFDVSWRGGAVLLLVWIIVKAVPAMPAKVRCWLWRAAYLKLLVGLVWVTPVHLTVPAWLMPASLRQPLQHDLSAPSSPPTAAATPHLDAPNLAAPRNALPRAAPPAAVPARSPSFWPVALFLLWNIYGFGYLGRLVRLWHRARLLQGQGMPVTDPTLLAEHASLCQQLRITPPSLLSHPLAPTPLLVGLRKPTVVLPQALPASRSVDELRLVLAHELAHLARHDLWWNWLPVLAGWLLGFHPLVWLARRRWKLSQEQAADEAALAVTGASAAQYGQVLIGVAKGGAGSLGALAVGAASESQWILKRRLTALNNLHIWSRRRLVMAGCIVIVLTFFAGVPLKLAAAQDAASPPAPRWEERRSMSTTTRPATQPEAPNIAFQGEVFANQADIRALTAGTIVRLPHKSGDAVKKGDVLVQFDSSQQDEALARAQAIAKTAADRAAFVASAFKGGLSSEGDFLQAKLEQERADGFVQQAAHDLKACTLRAPFDGVLGLAPAWEGQTVAAGQPITTLVQANDWHVRFSVDQLHINDIHTGMTVRVWPFQAKTPFPAQIDFISPVVGENNCIEATASPMGDVHPLRPGSYVTVGLSVGE